MIRIPKYVMVNAALFSLVVCLFSYGAAAAHSTGIRWHIEQGKISAELTNAPFIALVRQIEAQAGVWFKAGADLAGEKISARFTDIPLEQGLKRILRGMNHCLLYNADGSVAGVIVLGREKNHGKSTPAEVRGNLLESGPTAAAPGPNENNESSKISPLRLANPTTLSRAASHVRAKTPDMSLNLINRMSAQ